MKDWSRRVNICTQIVGAVRHLVNRRLAAEGDHGGGVQA